MSATLSDMLGAEAAPVEFVHSGETFTVTPVTQQVKTAIERHLRARAYEDLSSLRTIMPGEQYAEALEAITRDRASYAYLGPVFWATLNTRDGSLMMLRTLFQTTEDKASKLLDEREADVQAVVQETILSSMPRKQSDRTRAKIAERKAARESEGNARRPA